MTDRARYELKMWIALLKCIWNRKHLMVGLGRGENNSPYYCWQCFYNYPSQNKLRQIIGKLIPKDCSDA